MADANVMLQNHAYAADQPGATWAFLKL